MPNSNRHKRSTFFSHNSTVEALEGVYQEAQQVGSYGRGEGTVEGHGENPAKQGREADRIFFEQAYMTN